MLECWSARILEMIVVERDRITLHTLNNKVGSSSPDYSKACRLVVYMYLEDARRSSNILCMSHKKKSILLAALGSVYVCSHTTTISYLLQKCLPFRGHFAAILFI